MNMRNLKIAAAGASALLCAACAAPAGTALLSAGGAGGAAAVASTIANAGTTVNTALATASPVAQAICTFKDANHQFVQAGIVAGFNLAKRPAADVQKALSVDNQIFADLSATCDNLPTSTTDLLPKLTSLITQINANAAPAGVAVAMPVVAPAAAH